MELTVSLETICRIVIRARENEAQVPAVDPDDSSSAIDDNAMEVLEDENNVSIEEELNAIIEDLADDQALEVIALALVGRGSFDASEWEDALEAAAEEITPSPCYWSGCQGCLECEADPFPLPGEDSGELQLAMEEAGWGVGIDWQASNQQDRQS